MSINTAKVEYEAIPVALTRPRDMLLVNDASAALLLVWYLVPMFREATRSMGYAAFLGLWLITSFCIRRTWLDARRTGFWVLNMWLVVYIANFLAGRSSMFAEYLYVMTTAFAPALLFVFYIRSGQMHKFRFFAILALILFALTGITTFVGQLVYPNSARLLSTGVVTSMTDEYNRFNIANYGFAYSLMLLCIPLTVFARSREVPTQRLKLFTLVACFMIVVFMTQFSIALLLMIAGVLTACFGVKRIGIASFALVAAGSVLIVVLQDITLVANDSALGERISNLFELLRSGNFTGDLLLRTDKYLISIQTLLRTPLLGAGGYYGYTIAQQGIGGHAELFDMMARFGLVGTVPIVAFYGFYYRYIIGIAGKSKLLRGIILCVTFFAILSIVNVLYNGVEIGVTVLFIIPAMLWIDKPENDHGYRIREA